LILVNDGSTDSSLIKIQSFDVSKSKMRIISSSNNQGISASRNLAMKEVKGDIFVFTDADCYFNPDWLEKLIKPFGLDNVGCVGGPDENPRDDIIIRNCIDYSMHSLIGSGGLRRGELSLAMYSPAGCNMAIKREVIEKVGMFNESLRLRGDDKEIVHRIRSSGYKIIYAKEAKVWHWRRSSIKSFIRQTFMSGMARADILWIAPDAFEIAHLAPAVLLFVILSGVFFSLISLQTSAIWSAVFYLYGVALLMDGLLGSIKLKDMSAFFVIPFTSAIIHFSYGGGFLVRLLQGMLFGKGRYKKFNDYLDLK